MNRLARERSAYLQHAKEQAIDWYPWSEEAFEKAGRESKPVFLSSGAQWCHWCHVMARESFEDEEVARLLNEHFISIKLDRDERPDVDRRYQQVTAVMGHGGGWPLSIFLTPEKKPFFGGTYFPPEAGFGRPGFKDILRTVSRLYREKKDEIDAYGAELVEMLKPGPSPAGKADESMVHSCVRQILVEYDGKYGGFGTAPKFPMSGALELLINRFFLTKEERLGDAVKKTLFNMAKGGIHDHLGGGFHRYSTDQEWLIPHFEKMADDNAWLLRNYTDAYAVFGEPRFREVAEGILHFFRTDLSDPSGGFYASQDADVSPEDEGGYFTWTDGDFKAVLDETGYAVLSAYFLHGKGAMHHDASKKVLFTAFPAEEIAKRLGMELRTVEGIIGEGKRKLLEARRRRQRPFVDTALYTSLNGLVISAFLKAYRALGIEEARDFALASIDRIRALNVSGGRLLHSEGVDALLDDYIFFSDALVAAYEVTGRTDYLEQGRMFMDACITRFRDESGSGFYDTEDEVIGMRLKSIEDMPHPSANALAIPVLNRLSFACGDERYRTLAREALDAFSLRAQPIGLHSAYYFCALDGYFNLSELTCNLLPGSDLARGALSVFCPYEAIRYGEDRGYIIPCRRGTCFEPVTGVEALKESLTGRST